MAELPILGTKLHTPALPPTWVHRPQLTALLDEGIAFGGRLTLVSAPAGFGKSTFVAGWLRGKRDLPHSWLALDPEDDDPIRFMRYLLAAFRRVDERIGRDLEGSLDSGQLPPSEVIRSTLANDLLSCEQDFVLVLDDVHVLQDPVVLAVVEGLTATAWPALHLVIITREDPPIPLARLRAHSHLTEIRAMDLRFTGADTVEFLEQTLGLSLSRSDIEVLDAKTEGWIVGLKLAGMSLRHTENPSAFIENLSGGHRTILQYLVEQVLDRQPAEIRQFLLETSILDRMCGDLCDEVTGRKDSRLFLRRLLAANLFIVSLDDEGRWYRYHHLFADLLREFSAELSEERVTELHRRACDWFTASSQPAEAVAHAFAGRQYHAALELIEAHAMQMIMQGYAKTLTRWAASLPAEWAARSHRTNLAFAWMHFHRHHFDDAERYLDRVDRAGADEGGGPAIRAELMAMQSLLETARGDSRRGDALATEALRIAPEREMRVRSLAHFASAHAADTLGDAGRAADQFRAAIRLGRDADSLAAEIMSASRLGGIVVERGNLRLAYEIAEPMVARAEKLASPPPSYGMIYGLLAEVELRWFRIQDARTHWMHAFHLCSIGGYRSGSIGCHVKLAHIARLEGDVVTAAHHMRSAVELIQSDTPEYVRHETIAEQVRLSLAEGRVEAARIELETTGFSFDRDLVHLASPGSREASHSADALLGAALHYLVHQSGSARPSLPGVMKVLEERIARALEGSRVLVAVEMLLLHAQLAAATGDESSTKVIDSDYQRALELAEPGGAIEVFMDCGDQVCEVMSALIAERRLEGPAADFARRIVTLGLQAKPQGTDSTPSESAPSTVTGDLLENLTARELDVMRLLAEGLLYKEIAGRLFVSMNTVRFHVKSIYAKLAVRNRTQALLKAHALNLI